MVTVMLFIPVMLAFGVASVDVGYINSEKAKMQAVADMAVVSALGTCTWQDTDVATEEAEITASINSYLTQNGYPADHFGTPTFGHDTDDNVNKVTIEEKVSVRTFFWSWLTKTKGTRLDVYLKSSAEVEYSPPITIQIPDFGVYAKNQAYLQGNSLTANSNDSSDGSSGSDLYYDLAIGAGMEIYFNAALDYFGDLYTTNVIDAAGATVYGDVLAGDLSNSDPPTTYDREFTMGDTDIDIKTNSTTETDSQEVPMPNLTLDVITETDVQADPNYMTWADFLAYSGDGGATTNADALKTTGQGFSIKNGATIYIPAGSQILIPDGFASSQGSIVIDGTSTDPTVINSSYDFDASGQFSANGNLLKFNSTNEDETNRPEFKFNGSTELYMDIYAPNADVTVSGSATMTGRIFAYDVSIQSDFIFDKSLEDPPYTWDVPPMIKVKAHLVND
jgi:hypothetical protein